jgi:hypothetical protein
MDLNELLRAHQLEVMKAAPSGDENLYGMISEYAERIRRLRPIEKSSPIPQHPSAPPTIIYGSYAGKTAAPKSEAPSSALSMMPLGELSENPDRGQADA